MTRQIPHEAAPFSTVNVALDVGMAVLRELYREDGGSPIGAFAERQPNGVGYFVRVAWTVPLPRATPRARKRRETRAAEIGLIRCDAATAAHVAIVHELHEQSTGGIIDDQVDAPKAATIVGLREIDVERLASAVVRAIRKGTGQ